MESSKKAYVKHPPVNRLAGDEVNNYVGQRLRLRRTMLGMSQEAVGKGIGVASQQVQKYEKGTNVMNAIRLYEFAQFLKVPVEYFYEGLESQAKSSGFEEKGEEFEGEFKAATDRESLELLKSFKQIKDYSVRKRIADMLRILSQKDI